MNVERNKPVVNIMPGICPDTGDIKSFPIRNTIITGKIGNGVGTLVNSIMVHLTMFSSPNQVTVEYYTDNASAGVSDWLNPNRVIPHLKSGGSSAEAWTRLENMVIALNDVKYMYNLDDECPLTEYGYVRKNISVIILDNLDRMIDETHLSASRCMNVLQYLLEKGPSVGLYFIIRADALVRYLMPLIHLIPSRLVCRTDVDISEDLLGCNIASKAGLIPHGMVCYYNIENCFVHQILNIKFYPDTFIRKLVKMYSGSSKEQPNMHFDYLLEKLKNNDYQLTNSEIMSYVQDGVQDYRHVFDVTDKRQLLDVLTHIDSSELREKYLELITKTK